MADIINTHEAELEDASHTSEMLQKAEELENINAGEERPEWLPSKFKSVEDMASAYNELESKMGRSDDDEDDADYDEEEYEFDQDEVENSTADDANEFLDELGLDYTSFVQDYQANGGELSEEAYAALEEAGLSSELVDSFIAGQEAVVQDMRETAYDIVGGEAEYTDMIEWAQANLGETEINAFNRALETDMDSALFAIQGLASVYRSDVGVEPQLFEGTPATSAGAFSSVAELTAAMKDSRYESDPAYRQSVAAKLSRSDIL